MADSLARALIADLLVEGDLEPDGEIALRIDQVLVHDAAGPLCALQLDATGLVPRSGGTSTSRVG